MNGELIAVALIGLLIARELYGVAKRRSWKVMMVLDVLIVPLFSFFVFDVIQGILEIMGR